MKIRNLLLVLLVPFVFGCVEPTPAPEPTQATISAADVTVDEGATAQINAVTNSSAAISYTAADPTVATVSATGLVTGVKAGSTTVSLKVDAVEDLFTAAEATINVTVTAVEVPPVPEDVYADAAPEVKDGDVVLACNANAEKFLTDVHYNTHDYTSTQLISWAQENSVMVCPGNSDRPSEYSIRWTPDAKAGEVTVTVSEPDRDWVYTADAEVGYVDIRYSSRHVSATAATLAAGLPKTARLSSTARFTAAAVWNLPISPSPARIPSRQRASRLSWTSAATATYSPRVPSRVSWMTMYSALP